jgi:hypothetical protein
VEGGDIRLRVGELLALLLDAVVQEALAARGRRQRDAPRFLVALDQTIHGVGRDLRAPVAKGHLDHVAARQRADGEALLHAVGGRGQRDVDRLAFEARIERLDAHALDRLPHYLRAAQDLSRRAATSRAQLRRCRRAADQQRGARLVDLRMNAWPRRHRATPGGAPARRQRRLRRAHG